MINYLTIVTGKLCAGHYFKKLQKYVAIVNKLPLCCDDADRSDRQNPSLNKGTTKEICLVIITHMQNKS